MAEGPFTPESAADVLLAGVAAVEPPPVVAPDLDPENSAPPTSEEPAAPEAAVSEDDNKKIAQSVSFKEETNVVGDLPDAQKKALEELKKLVQEALEKHEFTPLPPPPPPEDKKQEGEHHPPSADAEGEPVPPPPPVEEVAAAFVVDDDGTKTVEAIEETVVAVSAPEKIEDPTAEEKGPEPTKQEPEPAEAEHQPQPPPPEEVFLWGIPLLGDERSDTILLKFLRARDFKVKDAFSMIKNTVRWRKEFRVDSLLEEEDLDGAAYEKAVFVHGFDRENRPVVYNELGEYQSAFSDAEKQKKFLKWVVRFLEKNVRKLDFGATGISSFVLVNDLKNSPGHGKNKVTNKFLQLLQDNYPEFVAKQVCINVSWWYLAYSWVYISVFTPRSKSKFVFAGTAKTAETLFKYIAPEHVPVQYGGHSRAGELEFTTEDSVVEVNIKPGGKHTVALSFTEPCVLSWELRVVGWDVIYEAQFVPAEGYTVLVSKPRKVTLADDPIIVDSYKVAEAGKVVLSIDNQSSKKKKFLYRSKIKPSQ